MNLKNPSLKFKLVTLTMGITLLVGLGTFGVLKYIVKTQEESQLKAFESSADTLGDAVAAQYFERYGDIQAFAVNPDIKSPKKEIIVEALNTYSSLYQIYDLIMVVDSKGRLVAATSRSPDGKPINVSSLYQQNFSETPWFKAVMEDKLTNDKSKGFSGTFVEDVHVDPWVSKIYGGRRLGNSFSTPIKDEKGNVMGVITNRAGARWWESAFKEHYLGLRGAGYRSAELMLLSSDATILFEFKPDLTNENGDNQPYNWDELLKFNLAKAGVQAGIKATQKSAGAIVETNARTKVVQVSGYAPITGPKFTESLGWSILVRIPQAEANAILNKAQNIFYYVLAVMMIIACTLSFLYSNSLSTSLNELASKLNNESTEVLSAATQIADSSTKLSEATTEQAAAIQETAASIDQVSSMVKKSAENAAHSQKVSQSSREAADQGQRSVQEMMHSIEEIAKSNQTIMTQVEEGNKQIADIVKVIAEIGNKTKIINDIVFQTKLLSFNASVEAARAGEHGKGFAVVAEEVGNLAQMSGNAAKEISSMLDGSIKKVETIVNSTRSKVEGLVTENREKVKNGTEVAKRCSESLNSILSSVQEVDGMVGEIASASHEQSQGVSEINKAMNQLDQVTQQNSNIAQNAAKSAESLKNQSHALEALVQSLNGLILGGVDSNRSPNSEAIHAPTFDHKKAAQNPTLTANVIPFPEKKKAISRQESKIDTSKIASGQNAAVTNGDVPSHDDPRFEDV